MITEKAMNHLELIAQQVGFSRREDYVWCGAPISAGDYKAHKDDVLESQALKEDLEGVLDGWGDAFGGSDRHERFTTAVEELSGIADSLDGIDVSWG